MGIEKNIIEFINLLALLSVVIFPLLNTKKLAFAAITTLVLQVILTLFLVYNIFANGISEYSYTGSFITGIISVKIDYLSIWMLLTISFTFFTGAWYLGFII